ncbi:glycosyltransferase family 9 protein [Flavihumibacter petaseus]|uniref:Putative glycosyltransferase n=1 Tax=Flavihumibacter petaseus NBRC 106054 TaxID=1220578 RepID=A0A0E9N5U6_9BACT|nr:glycosyltransferase family 9 protein [Flavihumibacter petaseus]GAO45194.1 putative glycosyltransferase [Flavihumibacter petaseus NBRC 106054]
MKGKILVVKTGAAGDVVRSTVILTAFPDYEITWITDPVVAGLLPDLPNLRVIDYKNIPAIVTDESYDMVFSLEETETLARMATSVKSKQLIGMKWEDGKVTYDENEGAGWFDMSLVSKLGSKEKANALKMVNTKTFQEYLFGMMGRPFSGQAYSIYQPRTASVKGVIGIEDRAGARWPNKVWEGYPELQQRLKDLGYEIVVFEQKADIRDYLEMIAGCSYVISGDTLAMHIALAYKIPSIAIFVVTSATEIHDYDTMTKFVHPRMNDFFYSNSYHPELEGYIKVEEVLQQVLRDLEPAAKSA